jgi:Skp family chaperone for outer membrane proteins
MYQNLFFILFISFLSFNESIADEKISYVDVDYILSNSLAGKSLLENLKKEEKLRIDKFLIKDNEFKEKEKKILAKKNLITEKEINKELRSLQIEFENYRKNKIKEIDKLKSKRKRNILNFINLINPIIEKYMLDNSIDILLDKKNVFIASKNYDITNKLIKIINNKVENIDIK